MQCGGQGIYLWFLARELARLGHHVDVLVGPPWPDPMPFAGIGRAHRERDVLGQVVPARLEEPAAAPAPAARVRAAPLLRVRGARAWASCPSPSPSACAPSARSRGACARASATTSCTTCSRSATGCSAMRALGLPVVSTVHHPLSVDRRAAFARARTLREPLGAFEFYPVEMQGFVARRLERVFTSSEVERAPDRARLRRAARAAGDGGERPRHGAVLARIPRAARAPASCSAWARASDPNKGIPTLIAALARLPAPSRSRSSTGRERGAALGARGSAVAERLTITGRIESDELVRALPARGAGRGAVALRGLRPARRGGDGLRRPRRRERTPARCPRWWASGGGGVLVPPDDPEALAKAIAALLEQPDTRRALGARARARIDAAYAWPRVAERTAAEYRARPGRARRAPRRRHGGSSGRACGPAPVSGAMTSAPTSEAGSASGGQRRAARAADQHDHVGERGQRAAPARRAPASSACATRCGRRPTLRVQAGSPQPARRPRTRSSCRCALGLGAQQASS